MTRVNLTMRVLRDLRQRLQADLARLIAPLRPLATDDRQALSAVLRARADALWVQVQQVFAGDDDRPARARA